ncbi:Protein of unknown function (DUF2891) [Streptoalloteichus tenebrarius]|uniref:DUF2891 domain-containing protein n=1 Tax=Streptoalloteichus tenebrarius (strain ATCC 17920 / DSM 40477 / JCM 4838 / CBS 697.72 / NBRC 16177 / NCIMB 11028 / NRRL B-12390 / A12253. 1 / ISP 5477) TaxID=1933 RepID=A0ABT1HMG7_STRSD|nr:DUF2891 domain-containing protein [Streptoalloteichus tenebrarius]MCP2256722.1 Protein of unknown function (DUF2891) [Streptoalloteichus tenebrarius]BFF00377.1 DUF2891 domain-containing protein [Streptoalloteichus tenebrarius]
MSRLDDTETTGLLAQAVANVRRDYPVHWTHLVHSPSELVPQRALHPVFAGSYDWHSCVHQTWLLVRLLRLRPDLPGADRARDALDELLTPEACAVEADFFRGEEGRHWERPYGWAWLLLLVAELRTWAETDTGDAGADDIGRKAAGRWADALRPLAEVLRGRLLDWLPTTRFPLRAGAHGNTAFALSLILDAARSTSDDELATCCERTALRWYGSDTDYGAYEPDAADFLSPALVEADLMRRVLDRAAFVTWLDRFLPDLAGPRWAGLRAPVPVDDPADPYGSHLAGLALSRAWCWRAVAEALPADHRFRSLAAAAAREHAEVGRTFLFGHGYAAEHWLGTFAVYLDLGALTG